MGSQMKIAGLISCTTEVLFENILPLHILEYTSFFPTTALYSQVLG